MTFEWHDSRAHLIQRGTAEHPDAPDNVSIIGCDLNESVRGAVGASLAETYQDAFAVAGRGDGNTYPTPDAATRQDFVFVSPGLTVAACFVPSDDSVDVASHHRPVVADLAPD